MSFFEYINPVHLQKCNFKNKIQIEYINTCFETLSIIQVHTYLFMVLILLESKHKC